MSGEIDVHSLGNPLVRTSGKLTINLGHPVHMRWRYCDALFCRNGKLIVYF